MASCCDNDCLTSVSYLLDDCINVIGDGSQTNPLQIEVTVNPDPDNIITCTPDGLFAVGTTSTLRNDGNGVYTFVGGGTSTTINVCSDVANFCDSSVALAADGLSFVHTANSGTQTTIPVGGQETTTTLTESGNTGVYTYTNELGAVTTIDVCDDVTTNCNSTLTANADGSFTHLSNSGVSTTIPAPTPETVTTLVTNADGSLTYTNEAGAVSTFTPATSTLAASTAGVVTHNNGLGGITSFDICSIVEANCSDSLVVNANGSATHTAIDGTVTVIPAAPGETTTTLVETGTTGIYVYTNEAGSSTTIDVCNDIRTNCNAQLVNNGDGSFTHTANTGAQVTIPAPPVPPAQITTTLVETGTTGIYTYTNEANATTTIDVCGDVVANCDATLTLNPNGSFTHTSNSGTNTTIPAAVAETTTTLVETGTTGVYVYTNEAGATTTIDVCADITANCDSTLVANADGSFTHTSNSGTATAIPAPVAETVTTLVETGTTGVYTFTNEAAVVTTIDVCADVVANCNPSLTANADNSLTFVDAAGATTNIPASFGEINTTLADNNNGTITYTDEAAANTIIDICAIVSGNCDSSLVLNVDGTATFTSNGGTVTTLPAAPGETVTSLTETGTTGVYVYTSENSTVTTIDVCADIVANCDATLTANADGTFTHVSNSGTSTVIPAPIPETTTTLVETGTTGVYTYTNEAAVVTTIDVCADVVANCDAALTANVDGSFTHTSNSGATTDIPAAIPETTTTLVETGTTGVYAYTNEAAVVTTIDVCGDIVANCNATLTANVDGSFTHTSNGGVATAIPAPVVTTLVETGTTGVYTYTNEAAATTTIDVCADVIANCNSTLIANVDGSFTHTSNGGATTVIPAAVGETTTTLVETGTTGVYVYTNEAAATTTIDVCADIIANCNSTMSINVDDSFTHTSNSGVQTIIPAETTTLLIETGTTGVYRYVNEAGTITTIDVCADVATNCDATLIANVDGTFTHTSNGGVQTIIPVSGALTVLDTDCIDLTITGAGTAAAPFVLSADPIVSPDVCNSLECRANGMYSGNQQEIEMNINGLLQSGEYTDGTRPVALDQRITNLAFVTLDASATTTSYQILVNGVVGYTFSTAQNVIRGVRNNINLDISAGDRLTIGVVNTGTVDQLGSNTNITLATCVL